MGIRLYCLTCKQKKNNRTPQKNEDPNQKTQSPRIQPRESSLGKSSSRGQFWSLPRPRALPLLGHSSGRWSLGGLARCRVHDNRARVKRKGVRPSGRALRGAGAQARKKERFRETFPCNTRKKDDFPLPSTKRQRLNSKGIHPKGKKSLSRVWSDTCFW